MLLLLSSPPAEMFEDEKYDVKNLGMDQIDDDIGGDEVGSSSLDIRQAPVGGDSAR